MRALVLALVALLLATTAPATNAEYGLHYGSLEEGCGPGSVLGDRWVDCPNASHGGYLTQAGCEGETCGLFLWHSARAQSNAPRAVEVRSVLRVEGVETLLCAASGTGTLVRCDISERVAFPLSEGCHDALLLTSAREAGAGFGARGTASFHLCREGSEVWVGPSAAYHWFGAGQWSCMGKELGVLFVGCHQGVSGLVGAESCDEARCVIAVDAGAGAESSMSGPGAVELRLVTPAGVEPVCADAAVGFHVVCDGLVRVPLALALGECATLRLETTIAMAAPPGVDRLAASTSACRVGWGVDFTNA